MSPDWEKRIMTVSRGEITGIRIDAEFALNNHGATLSQNSVKLGDITYLKAGGTPRRGQEKFWLNGNIPWVKSGELKDNLDIQDIEESITQDGLKNSSAKLFDKGTLLIAMYGATAGEVGILGREACTNQAVCSIIPKGKNVINEYLFWSLLLLRKKIKQDASGGAQPNISKEYLDNLHIPLPPLEIQKEIIELMDRCIAEKQKLETEADKMMASINDWLLGELGIERGDQEEKKVFSLNIQELNPDLRIDPSHYLKEKQQPSNRYNMSNISNIATVAKGQSLSSSDLGEGDIPVIAGGQNSPYNHNISNYSGNVITVSASGAYSGFVWYHEIPIFASDCNVIFSNDEKNITTKFIACYLKSKQKFIYSLQKGAGQPHVYPNDLKEMQIPLPPHPEQERIVNHISDIIARARAMRKQATRVYEEARAEVEKIISEI